MEKRYRGDEALLYVNTKNKYETYTAHQALSLQSSYTDGVIAPIRLPFFNKSELSDIYKLGFSGASAFILNKFFSKGISVKDMNEAIDFSIASSELLDRKTLIIRFDGKFSELEKSIYRLMLNDDTAPTLWGRCAIRISLLFGIFGELIPCGIRGADFAVASDDVLSIIPVLYGKAMGLPVNKIIVGASYEDAIWNFLHKDQDGSGDVYEYFRHGVSAAAHIVTDVFSFVVSKARAGEIITNVQSTYNKSIDLSAAFSYGALQDHRAVTGENRTTIIFNN